MYTREQLAQGWAITQNNLGAALSDQARRSEGPEAVELLAEAVTAYRSALEVYNEAEFARYHAIVTQNLERATKSA